MNIGERIRDRRTELRLTLNDISKRAGVSDSINYGSRHFNGSRPFCNTPVTHCNKKSGHISAPKTEMEIKIMEYMQNR